MKLWDVRQKSCVATYKLHSESIRCLDISPNGQYIASGSADGTLRIWDVTRGGKCMHTFKVNESNSNELHYASCVAFNPEDFCVAAGISDKTIRYWNLQDFTSVACTFAEAHMP